MSVAFTAPPASLDSLRIWLAWWWDEEHDRKVPVDARGNPADRAAVSDLSFAEAVERFTKVIEGRGRRGGVGYFARPKNGLADFDLDACRDPETGAIEGWARAIVEALASFTQVTPSGTGLRVTVRAQTPEVKSVVLDGASLRRAPNVPATKHAKVEVFTGASNFVAYTGARFDGTPDEVRDAQAAVDALRPRLAAPASTVKADPLAFESKPNALSDKELVGRIERSRDAALWHRLFVAGEWARGSQSEADLALCLLLAYWTGRDVTRMDAFFRKSALARDKWDASSGKLTYGQRTLRAACLKMDAVFEPEAPGARERFIVRFDEWLASPPPPVRWLAAGLVELGAWGWLFGDPGVCKSWLLYDLTHAVASGTAWLGRAVEHGVAYLVRGEGARHDTFRCLKRLAVGRELAPEVGARIVVDHSAYDLATADGLGELRANVAHAVKRNGWAGEPLLLGVDVFAEFLGGGDDQDLTVLQPALQNLRTLVSSFDDAALVVLDHPRKRIQGPSADRAPVLRGRVQKRGAADFGIAVRAVYEPDTATKFVELSCDKARHEEFAPLAARLTWDASRATIVPADAAELARAYAVEAAEKQAAKLDAVEEAYLNVLRDGQTLNAREFRELVTGLGGSAVKDQVRERLVAQGVLTKDEERGPRGARQYRVARRPEEAL